MEKSIWERLNNGEKITMSEDREYLEVTSMEMYRCLGLCSELNKYKANDPKIRETLDELLENRLPYNSDILPPMQIDYGHQLRIHNRVFINHSVCINAAA